MNFDVAIIGGSFAGLSSAYFLSKLGLNVCLFDSRKIGAFTKSTGLLTDSVMDDLNVPKKLIESDIIGNYLYSPKMVEYEYRFPKAIFHQSKTLKFIEWLKSKALDRNTTFFEKSTCKSVRFTRDKVLVENVNAKLVVIASGPLQDFVPVKSKQVLYTGLEYISKCDIIKDERMWQSYFDYNICPGYFAWISPITSDTAHIGVLCKNNSISASTAMERFIKKIKLNIKIHEKRGGVVSLGGSVEKTYGDRFVLIGDSACQIGSISSAGINYSVRAAKILADVLSNSIDNPNKKRLSEYETQCKASFGKLLAEELELRKLYDTVNDNSEIERGLKLASKIPKETIFDIMDRFSKLNQLNYKTSLLSTMPKLVAKHFIQKLF